MKNDAGKYSDKVLIVGLKAGGEEGEKAFTVIYKKYSPKVIAYCRSMVANRQEAEDIFQETFIRFYNSAAQRSTKAEERRNSVDDRLEPADEDGDLIVERQFMDDERINILGYLMKTARNLCLNFLRDNSGRTKKMTMVSLDEIENKYVSQQDDKIYEKNELYDAIMESLDLIDEKYKETFILREIEGFSYIEIADMCGLSLSNAKSRVIRAREKLIEILQPYLND